MEETMNSNVSMPYFGLFSFLRLYCGLQLCKKIAFQCPTSGFSLFYAPQNKSFLKVQSPVSMPYFGLFSFLRDEILELLDTIALFQCPTSGFSLFYEKTIFISFL